MTMVEMIEFKKENYSDEYLESYAEELFDEISKIDGEIARLVSTKENLIKIIDSIDAAD